MEDRQYYIKISPEVIKHKFEDLPYTGDSYNEEHYYEVCCDIYTSGVTKYYTGTTKVYLSMEHIVTGGTNGNSMLTDLSVPIMLTETVTDFGYYSVFDGAIYQSDIINNFLFTPDINNPMSCVLHNTSEINLIPFLKDYVYTVDWGDGMVTETVTGVMNHTYTQTGPFTITMSGASFGVINTVKKDVVIPFTPLTITDPKGVATFTPQNGSWSGTPISYDYIYPEDAVCDKEIHSSDRFTTLPYIISGYTNSTINDLQVYGPIDTLFAGKFKLDTQVKVSNDIVGTVWSSTDPNQIYTAYTINEIDYYDYPGKLNNTEYSTLFIVKSSGLTFDDLVCTGITKNEALINVIDEPEIQSDIFIERGQYSAFESMQRLNEVDNMGSLTKYGYGFFSIRTT